MSIVVGYFGYLAYITLQIPERLIQSVQKFEMINTVKHYLKSIIIVAVLFIILMLVINADSISYTIQTICPSIHDFINCTGKVFSALSPYISLM